MNKHNYSDNLGNQLSLGEHVGYIYGGKGHNRIHSGLVVKLCDKIVWIKPDEVFNDDVPLNEEYEDTYLDMHPYHKISKYDKLYKVSYGKVVKLGY